MGDIFGKTRGFLRTCGVSPENIVIGDVCDVFEAEMELGLSSYSGGGSLMMIPTFVKIDDNIPADEPVIVIDAGGTNLRTALVRFDKDARCVVEKFENRPMPGSKTALSKEAFFDELAGFVEPLLAHSRKIGFCFSYPVAILPNKDGRVVSLSKEVRVDGLTGELMNENLIRKLAERAGSAAADPSPSFVLINDTVATMIGGKTATHGRVFDGYVGFILGTGTNACYAEDCGRIGKLSEVLPGGAASFGAPSMIINIESGNFNKAPRGVPDERLDAKTKDRGMYAFEKAISGAYQGPLLKEIIELAASEGLFDGDAASRFSALPSVSARDIDLFLDRPFGDNALAAACGGSPRGGDSAETLYYLIDAMFERMSMFVAAHITAIMRRTGRGKNPCAPVCVTADGTTFYKSKLLRSKVDRHVRLFTNEVCGHYCEFVKAENAVLAGTAVAALQNCD